MNEFKKYHPAINFIYFSVVILTTMFFMHPVILLCSFFGALLNCRVMLGGEKTKKLLKMTVVVFLLTSLVNPLFSHEGVTVIAHFPGGNPLTGEAIFFGIMSGIMIVNAILWFSCFNVIVTDDKIYYLFGKISPLLALLFSMIIGFVPSFILYIRKFSESFLCLGKNRKGKKTLDRAKNGLGILWGATGYSLESSVDIADSMKARGYGSGKRSAYTVYRFYKRDAFSLACIIFCVTIITLGVLYGGLDFEYFPSVDKIGMGFENIFVYFLWIILCLYPAMINFWEVRRWNLLK